MFYKLLMKLHKIKKRDLSNSLFIKVDFASHKVEFIPCKLC